MPKNVPQTCPDIKKANEYEKNRCATNEEYRVKKNLRHFLHRLIKEKKGRTADILGYSVNDFIKSMGGIPTRQQSIDHKIPISWFIKDVPPFIIHALDNLQILTRSENFKKNNTRCDPVSVEYFNCCKVYIKPEYLNKIKLYGTS